MGAKLTVQDIADLRAYERERDEFRARIIELKKRRRVPVGPLITLVFENRDTVRYQVQEMARAERMRSDEQIQSELDVYNPLIPEPGELTATLFLELTTREQLEEWLPKLVGIEHAVELRIGPDAVRATPEAGHAVQLTREDTTASVHYVRFELNRDQTERFETEPLQLAIDHAAYSYATSLSEDTRLSVLSDLGRSAG